VPFWLLTRINVPRYWFQVPSAILVPRLRILKNFIWLPALVLFWWLSVTEISSHTCSQDYSLICIFNWCRKVEYKYYLTEEMTSDRNHSSIKNSNNANTFWMEYCALFLLDGIKGCLATFIELSCMYEFLYIYCWWVCITAW